VRDPQVDGDSSHYWERAKARELVVQQCDSCREFVFYPRSVCPHCHSADLSWRVSAGEGTVYSYTVSRRAPSPEFEGMVPYVVVLVDLDEGFRMMGHGEPSLVIADRVHCQFRSVADRLLPYFVACPEREKE
jgi:uncharacterized OB-fold protein